MRRSGLLLIAGLLAACQLSAPVAPKASRAPGSPSPAGKASTSPSVRPAAALPVLLAPLAGETSRLRGQLRVDANFLVAAGAGNLLSRNGAPLVAAGGLNLIGPDGASLVGPDGASLVGPDGASLVGPDGATIVAAGAGNVVAVTATQLTAAGGLQMVAAGGGNIVAAGGLNMVAAGAGNLVAAGAGNVVGNAGGNLAPYALAQATGPAAGAALPAAGMLVSVVSLATRQYLPLGQTPAGEQVYAVYSNARGDFEVTVPKGEEANLMVVASLPGRDAQGLVYNAITQPGAQVEVNEETATVTRYLRRTLVGRLADILAADSLDAANALLDAEPALGEDAASPARTQLKVVLGRMREIGQRAPGQALGSADRAVRERHASMIAQAIIDAALSRLALDQLRVNPALVSSWADPALRVELPGDDADRVLPLTLRCFSELHARAEQAMRQPAGGLAPFSPAFFQRVAVGASPHDWLGGKPAVQDWFAQVLTRYPSEPYPIAKPAQLGEFLVDRYLAVNRPYVHEPLMTTYMLLDPATYAPTPTIWDLELPDPATRARGEAALARINGLFPGLGLTLNDPVFSVAKRAPAARFAHTFNAVGFTLFLEIGLGVASPDTDVARAAEAAVRALALPAVL